MKISFIFPALDEEINISKAVGQLSGLEADFDIEILGKFEEQFVTLVEQIVGIVTVGVNFRDFTIEVCEFVKDPVGFGYSDLFCYSVC